MIHYLQEAIELHRCLPVFVGYFNFSSETFRAEGGQQSDLEKLDAANIKTIVASIGFGCYFHLGDRDYQLAGSDEWLLEQQCLRIQKVRDTVQECSRTHLVTDRNDLRQNQDISVVIHLTGNNHTIDLDSVDRFYDLGVRAIHPAMQYHNRYCTGLEGIPGPALSDFGREVIGRMNELGIVVDTAHASDESAEAMIEASSKPVIDSHTTSRNLVPSSRGLSDQLLRKIADRGGVVGIHFADHLISQKAWETKYTLYEKDGMTNSGFEPRIWKYNRHVLALTDDPEKRMKLRRDQKEQETFFEEHKLPPDPAISATPSVNIANLADVVDYLIKICGNEHVGIGGDVNGIDSHQWPEGMSHVGELPNLTAELLSRGYTHEQLAKLLSANWRRVYRDCLTSSV